MEPRRSLAEALADPAFAKEARDYGAGAAGHGVEQGRQANTGNASAGNTGNSGNGGMPTDNARLREISQDRPNPLTQSYTLATPTPVNAAEMGRIQGGVATDLSWHKDLVKIDRDLKEGFKEKENGHEQNGQQQQGQQQDRQHSREPQGRGR